MMGTRGDGRRPDSWRLFRTVATVFHKKRYSAVTRFGYQIYVIGSHATARYDRPYGWQRHASSKIAPIDDAPKTPGQTARWSLSRESALHIAAEWSLTMSFTSACLNSL